jgi:hypothetical protein
MFLYNQQYSCQYEGTSALKVFLEEARHGVDRRSPVLPKERIVDVIRQDQLFDEDTLFLQAAFQVDGLAKLNNPIIITMNEQNRRFPSRYC